MKIIFQFTFYYFKLLFKVFVKQVVYHGNGKKKENVWGKKANKMLIVISLNVLTWNR